MTIMFRLYDVTRNGYNSWKRRGKSDRVIEDERLYKLIKKIFDDSHGIYGSPKVYQVLRQQGVRIGRKRVARIMRENGLQSRVTRVYRVRNGQRRYFRDIPNRIREKEATKSNQIWIGDVTYIKIKEKWHYLAVVMDKYSRRLLGWSLSSSRETILTERVLKAVIRKRGAPAGLMFHSDRGQEYASYTFRNILAKHGIIQSMNRPKHMNDNAHQESFFHNLKGERLHKLTFSTMKELRSVINGYVSFYNQKRIHSSIDYLTPIEFECKLG